MMISKVKPLHKKVEETTHAIDSAEHKMAMLENKRKVHSALHMSGERVLLVSGEHILLMSGKGLYMCQDKGLYLCQGQKTGNRLYLFQGKDHGE